MCSPSPVSPISVIAPGGTASWLIPNLKTMLNPSPPYLLSTPKLQGTYSVQFSRSVVSDSATPWTVAHQASLPITNSQSLPKLMSIESVIPSNHLILPCPLLLLPSIFPSIRVFSNESVLRIRWPQYWSFSFSISPSNEYSGLISFRIDWLDLLIRVDIRLIILGLLI